MRVLVTGGKGFLGRNVSRRLAASGHRIVGCGRGNWSRDSLLKWGVSRWIEGDVDMNLLIASGEQPDVIVHCAGGSSVTRSIQSPYDDFMDTVAATAAVLEFVRMRCPGSRVVYPSSPAVHGEHDSSAIRITDACRPVSTYGFHKLMSETLCNNYRATYGSQVTVVRLFSLYGEGLRKQLLWDACGKLKHDGEAEFWGDGHETRDWVHVDDAVELVARLAGSSHQSLPPLLNCGSGAAHTTAYVLTMLRDCLQTTGEIRFNGLSRHGDPRHYRAELSEALALGWSPRVTLEDGLRRYVEWYGRQA